MLSIANVKAGRQAEHYYAAKDDYYGREEGLGNATVPVSHNFHQISVRSKHASPRQAGPVKILIVTDAWLPQDNAVVKTVGQIRSGLVQRGHDVDLITPVEFAGVRCPGHSELRLSLAPYGRVKRRIEQMCPDVVHIVTEGPLGLAARKFCLHEKLRFTSAYLTRYPELAEAGAKLPLSLSYAYLRRFHAPSQAVLVPAAAIRAELIRRGFDNTVLWPAGVDRELFTPGDRSFLATLRPIFLYAGRLAADKNVEAFLRLELPGSKWVVGDGPLRTRLERAYPKVRFAGAKAPIDLVHYYRAADVLVFPSLLETFGLTMLEALACGTPVAAYPVPGTVDLLASPEVGVLSEDLRQACLRALHLSRDDARAHSEAFSSHRSVAQFERYVSQFKSSSTARAVALSALA
jgi:hypothetical protein